jgi:hydroxypyruvate isomerase
VNWRAVAAGLKAQGYKGVVGLEARASGDPVDAMEALRAAFSE